MLVQDFKNLLVGVLKNLKLAMAHEPALDEHESLLGVSCNASTIQTPYIPQ